MNGSTLASFASPLVAANKFVKASFGGMAGSGKTRTATELIIGCYKDMGCKKPVLVIDNEKGSRFLIPIFNKAGIEVLVKDTVSLADVVQSLAYLKNGEIDFLFIDTLTKVWYQFVRDYKAKKSSRYTFMTLEDWGKILPAWQEEFSDKYVNTPGNIVFTGRGGYQYEKEEDVTDEDGKTKKGQFVKSGVKMKLAGETPFEPDLNVWMQLEQEMGTKGLEVWREAQIMKDRSGLIDGRTFKNPTYKDFQPVIQFLVDVPTGVVAGTSSAANLAPSDDHGYYQRKQAREIEAEKIKAQFEKYAIGTSKEDKQVKVLILEKCFGTASVIEMEKKDAETLREGRVRLEYLFLGWEGATDKLAYVKEFDPSKIPQNAWADMLFGAPSKAPAAAPVE